ncbi:EF-hand domain-containing protein [Lysobacter enzymogenes]|uniref:EF-hand domain-containing protein n=1 Tax=Lysobacter enzymogenes TaxID=69 RepID=UPI00099CDF80|nr:EF-hand domain-containing protein [Lysobacter enzymogenes]UZW60255.1 EF-hand domain-containing protein [Lysobacter enzymogenes]
MKNVIVLVALSAVAAVANAAPSDPKQAYIDATFSAMDANKDGRVDKSEYAKFQSSRFNQQAESVDAAFKEMDKDGDGKVSKKEAAIVPEIAKYFDGLDSDRDGFLSLKEMQQAMVAAQTADTSKK